MNGKSVIRFVKQKKTTDHKTSAKAQTQPCRHTVEHVPHTRLTPTSVEAK
jgi:hypothetical protein